MNEKIVLCGANAYDKKYYFNRKFERIPDSIKDELHIICVLFTEEVGGIITLAFEEDGTLVIETNAADDDFYYDEISSGLLVREIRRKKQDLLEALSSTVTTPTSMKVSTALSSPTVLNPSLKERSSSTPKRSSTEFSSAMPM